MWVFTLLHRKCNCVSFLVTTQVSLKSPDVLLTLPIHIGNISLDKRNQPSKKKKTSPPPATEDASVTVTSPGPATPTAKPAAPRPAPRHHAAQPRRSYTDGPSAPPQAELYDGAESETSGYNGQPNKRQSQLVNAFSYAPGLSFLQDNTSAALSPEAANSSSLYPQGKSSLNGQLCNGISTWTCVVFVVVLVYNNMQRLFISFNFNLKPTFSPSIMISLSPLFCFDVCCWLFCCKATLDFLKGAIQKGGRRRKRRRRYTIIYLRVLILLCFTHF